MKTTHTFIVVLLLSFLWYSCSEDTIEDFNENQNVLEHEVLAKGPSGKFCKFTLEFNAKSVTNPVTGKAECQSDPFNTCAIVDCIPDPFISLEPPLIVFDPCKIIPCGWDIQDPWYAQKFLKPSYMVSLKDNYPMYLNAAEEAIPIPLNRNLIVLQVYKEHPSLNYMGVSYSSNISTLGDPNPQPNIYFNLKNSLKLDYGLMKKLEMRGNVIKSGKYPVIYNKKEGTFNIVLQVNKGFYL